MILESSVKGGIDMPVITMEAAGLTREQKQQLVKELLRAQRV